MYSKTIFRIVSILIIAALVAAAFPKPAQAALCKRTVVVREGDTLSKIATRYHTTVRKLAYANNLDRPYEVTPGQTLCIPSDNVPSTRFKWWGVIKGSQLILTGDDFRKDHTFLVNGKIPSRDGMIFIGRTKTNSTGDLNAVFALESRLLRKDYLTVCLKDNVSRLTDCKRIFKQ
jgi:LysM repeat protein